MMTYISKYQFNVVLLSVLTLFCIPALSAPYFDTPYEFAQPDGSIISVILNGDEFYMQAETPEGYTVVRDPQTGWICYAELSADETELVSTGVPVSSGTESFIPSQDGRKKLPNGQTVRKKLKIKTEAKLQKIKQNQKQLFGDDFAVINGLAYPANTTEVTSYDEQSFEAYLPAQAAPGTLPPTKNISNFNATIKGLVLVFDFSDAPAQYTIEQYRDKVNKVNYHYGNGNAASLRTYYEDVSRGVFLMNHFVYGIYRAPQTFAYYDSLNYTEGAHQLLSYALNDMEAKGFDFSQLTTFSSGEIRALAVMYTGNPAAWAEGMWYHAGGWGGFSADGVHTGRYCTDSANNLSPGTLIHEHGHMAAEWPDTYSYIGGEPGTWGVMGGGYCDLPNPYFLYENGWLDAENIMDIPGWKTMNSSDPFFAYFYYDPAQPTEFYMMRPYVNNLLYCPDIPDQGMTFWRINTQGDNANYPNADRHIELVHANNTDTNKTNNVCFKEGGLLDQFTPFTTPSTNWKFGVKAGEQSGMDITDISAPAAEMTFVLGTPPAPIPYYSFNGSFNDASGSGYAATGYNFPGSQWSTDVFSGSYFNFSQSLQFDGVDDYVVCPPAVSSGAELTIAFWIKPGMRGDMTVLDKLSADASGTGWSVHLTQNGRVEFLIGSQSNKTSVITPYPVYEANRWVHIGCAYGNGTARIFVNGQIRTIKKGITQTTNTVASNVQMGIASQVNTNWIYQGLLDDVRFYDTAMESGPLNAIDGLNFKPDNGILALLKLDEAIGTLARDAGGRNHDGTLYNGLSFDSDSVAGPTGKALSFDGTDDYIKVPGFIEKTSKLTISAWIKTDDWNGNRRILQKGNDGAEYRLLAENGQFVFEVGSTRLQIASLPTPGIWVHIAAVYNGSTMRVYYDTVLKGSVARTGMVPATGNALYIGTKNADAVAGDHFKGPMNEIRIYNYALSDSEILDIYKNNRMDGPVPFSGADDVSPEVTLKFTPAANALRHDIYFGTEYNAVLNADTQSPEYVGRKQYTEYNPPSLQAWREYFWRVDEVLLNGTIQAGPVWRFSTTGRIQRQVWTGLSGANEVTTLTGSVNYPDNPSLVTELDTFEIPTNWADSYGTRVRGLLVPQTSGSYRFWISGDNEVELWLSTNANPANASRIAYIHGTWSDPLNFDQYTSQRSGYITLQAGQPYYIMALHKEGNGGDHMAVAWQGPDSPTRQIIDSFWLQPPVENEWPRFNSAVAPTQNAVEGVAFSAAMPVAANDPDSDNLSYTKQTGPHWLHVAANGQLWGTPDNSEVGINSFTIRAGDGKGGYDDTIIPINVVNRFTGSAGMEDLLGFAREWLNVDSDSPANLNQTAPVNIEDFSLMSGQWNIGLIEGLAAYWSLDDVAGLIARDNYAHHHGTLTNMTEYNWVSGVSNNALAFDGVDDYIEIPDFKGVTGTASRTCMAWIQTSAIQQGDIFSWGTEESGQKWMFRVESNGTLGVGIWGGYIDSVAAVNDGRWHHVAAVLNDDGSPNVSEILLYIDGVLQNATANNMQPINTGAGQNVMIGAFENAGVPGTYFAGKIDDVRIYDRILSHDEIAQAASAHLQLHLPLDETAGTIAHDISPQNRSGQLYNGCAWQPGFGVSGGSVLFDGVDDYVEIPSFKGVTGTASRTCMAWILTSGVQQGNIISWGTEQTGQKWMFRIESNGTLGVGIWGGYINSTAAVNDGQWHHVAAVLNDNGSPSVNEILLYIDGVLQSATANNTQSINTAVGQNVMIGAAENAGVPAIFFNGRIDEVQVYSRALTEAEIAVMVQ